MAVIVGLIGGGLCLCIKPFAIFALGGATGIVLGLVVMGVVNGEVAESTAEETWFILMMWGLTLLLCIICGFVALTLQRTLFILFTSILGSYLVVATLDYLIGEGTFSAMLRNAVEGVQNEMDQYVILAIVMWVILAVVGIVVQFLVTSRGFSHGAHAKNVVIVN